MPRFGAYFFLLCGTVGCAISLALAYHQFAFARAALRAQGLVIDLPRRGDQAKTQVAFTAQDGRRYVVLSLWSSRPPAYDVGDRVDVLYEPTHPQDARIVSFLERWASPVFLGLWGAVFWVLGMLFLAPKMKAARQKTKRV